MSGVETAGRAPAAGSAPDGAPTSAADGRLVPAPLPHASTIEVDGRIVVYDERAHSMLVLNASASGLWRRCDGATAIDDIVDDLAAAHVADRHVVMSDVWATVCKLVDLGLVVDVRSRVVPAR